MKKKLPTKPRIKKTRIIQGDCKAMDIVRQYMENRREWQEEINDSIKEHNKIIKQANKESQQILTNLWAEISNMYGINPEEVYENKYILDMDHYSTGEFILLLEMYDKNSEKEQNLDGFLKANEEEDKKNNKMDFEVDKKVIH